MPKGNWMYGDDLDKEKDMKKSVLDYQDKPKDIGILYCTAKILKWIGMTYVWGCAVGVTAFILISIYYYLGV